MNEQGGRGAGEQRGWAAFAGLMLLAALVIGACARVVVEPAYPGMEEGVYPDWQLEDPDPTATPGGIVVLQYGTGYASVLQVSLDGGDTWTEDSCIGSSAVFGGIVWRGAFYFLDETLGIMRYDGDECTVVMSPPAGGLTMTAYTTSDLGTDFKVSPDGNALLMAANDTAVEHALVYRTANGTEWTLVHNPSWSVCSDADYIASLGLYVDGSTMYHLITGCRSIEPEEPIAALYSSLDQGVTWSLIGEHMNYSDDDVTAGCFGGEWQAYSVEGGIFHALGYGNVYLGTHCADQGLCGAPDYVAKPWHISNSDFTQPCWSDSGDGDITWFNWTWGTSWPEAGFAGVPVRSALWRLGDETFVTGSSSRMFNKDDLTTAIMTGAGGWEMDGNSGWQVFALERSGTTRYLYKSTDGGSTFARVTALPTRALVAFGIGALATTTPTPAPTSTSQAWINEVYREVATPCLDYNLRRGCTWGDQFVEVAYPRSGSLAGWRIALEDGDGLEVCEYTIADDNLIWPVKAFWQDTFTPLVDLTPTPTATGVLTATPTGTVIPTPVDASCRQWPPEGSAVLYDTSGAERDRRPYFNATPNISWGAREWVRPEATWEYGTPSPGTGKPVTPTPSPTP